MRRCAILLAACGVSVGSAEPKSPPATSLDVSWSADGGVAIGTPRALLGSERSDALVARGLVFGTHDGWVTGWDPATGQVKVELGPMPDDHVAASSLAISGDGRTLAIGGEATVRVARAPFDHIEQTIHHCADAHALSHDGRFLACSLTSPVVWDLTTRTQVGRSPGPKQGTRAAAFTDDDRALVYATDTEIYRWWLDGSTAPVLVYRAAARFDVVTFAERATVAYVDWVDTTTFTHSAKLIALATGSTTNLPVNGGPGVVSPAGTRVAIALVGEVRVLDTATNASVWTTKTTEPVMPLAFAGDDTLAFVEGTRVRFAKLPGAPVVYPAPARFAGWFADDDVAIAQGGKVVRLSLVDHKETPVAVRPTTVAPKPGPRLEIAETIARLVDGTRELARFPVEVPRGGKDMAAVISGGAVSGSSVILLSHGPRSDGAATPACVSIGIETCVHDWTVSRWQLGPARLAWRTPTPAPLSGVIAFDHAGSRVLVGTTRGDVVVLALATGTSTIVHAFHHRITRLEVSPGDTRVLSEDAAGEQRIWRLP